MSTLRHRTLPLVAIVAMIVSACSGAASPSSTVPSSPSPSPIGGPVTTEAQAIARVIEHEPRFTGITKRDLGMIGQAHWYEVAPASAVGAFVVTVRIGWGDCPAGCIDEHRWVYAVTPDGGITVQSQTGAAVPPDAWPAPAGGGIGTGLLITAVAGPTCPVETIPPDPACAPRPVAGAIVLVRDGQGNDVGKAILDATGSAFVELPPGEYVVVAQGVEGFMVVPEPQKAVVVDGAATPVILAYDTGIR